MIVSDEWVQIWNGKQFWPEVPDSTRIDPQTIATVLSRIPRFGGHAIGDYSVAQHSINVFRLIETPILKLPAMLHDAHEAYTGFGDVLSPMKLALRNYYDHDGEGVSISFLDVLESRIDTAVAERFGFSPELFHHPEIERADLVMRATEKKFLMLEEPAPWGDMPPPLDSMPFVSFDGCKTMFFHILESLNGCKRVQTAG